MSIQNGDCASQQFRYANDKVIKIGLTGRALVAALGIQKRAVAR